MVCDSVECKGLKHYMLGQKTLREYQMHPCRSRQTKKRDHCCRLVPRVHTKSAAAGPGQVAPPAVHPPLRWHVQESPLALVTLQAMVPSLQRTTKNILPQVPY